MSTCQTWIALEKPFVVKTGVLKRKFKCVSMISLLQSLWDTILNSLKLYGIAKV